MRKDRNCMNPYPMYQQGMNMLPGIPPMPNMMGNQMMFDNNIESRLNNIESQISLLENRVSNLESMKNNNVSYNTEYNSSNYQMM